MSKFECRNCGTIFEENQMEIDKNNELCCPDCYSTNLEVK